MASLIIDGEKMNGELIIFHLFSKYCKEVFIKGILDMDYYEEKENPVQFLDGDRNTLPKPPDNPYEKGTLEWEAYDDIVSSFKITNEFIELLVNCIGLETYECENYNLEIENVYW